MKSLFRRAARLFAGPPPVAPPAADPFTRPSATADPPLGFTVQRLEPLGGKMLRPYGWFYAEWHHNSNSLGWTLSLGYPQHGQYVTGVRVQCLTGAGAALGKSPQQHVADNLARLAARPGVRVLGTRPEVDQGMFSRVGLEVLEGDFRVLYSAFWGNGMDVVVFLGAGTTAGQWEQYTPTFNLMSDFELVDTTRFGKSVTPAPGPPAPPPNSA